MRTIRGRLLVLLTLGMTALLLVGGVVVWFVVRSSLRDGFDESLASKAGLLVASLQLEVLPEHQQRITRLGASVLADLDEKGSAGVDLTERDELLLLAKRGFRVRLVLDPDSFPEYRSSSRPEYFEVSLESGDVLVRSGSLAGTTLGSWHGPAEWNLRDVTLPDGRAGRAIRVRVGNVKFADKLWSQAWSRIRGEARLPNTTAVVLVAKDLGDVEAALSSLRIGMVAVGLLVVAGAALLIFLVCGRALHPLRQLRHQLLDLDAAALRDRVHLDQTPPDLAPIVDSLNEGLARLERAFRRERRVAGHLAHELRTPVAELRAITDVARRWPEDQELRRRCVEQGNEIARHMGRVVSALLRVARAQSGECELETAQLRLDSLLQGAWERRGAAAKRRGQTFLMRGATDLSVDGDPEVTRAILTSLLQNAAEHAPEGSAIEGLLRRDGAGVELSITNPRDTPEVEAFNAAGDLPWNDDSASPSSGQPGLGLPLVAELTRASGIGFEVEVLSGEFRVSLAFPSSA